jgi:hypothetical protein
MFGSTYLGGFVEVFTEFALGGNQFRDSDQVVGD